ncbi:MAG TPA: hypothetical protein DCS93_17205 [Microscillaceae bacterium]|nr:hypothetical protein [Microscillaceae bacterium]
MLVLITSAIALGLFFVALLFTKKSKKRTDYLLICWLLVLTFQLAAYYAEIGLFKYGYFLAECSGACVFLQGPMLWLYLIGIHEKNALSFQQKTLIHFVPFIINVLLIPVLVIHNSYPMAMTLFFFKIIHLTSYMILSLKKLKYYRHIKEDIYSQADFNQTLWLKIVIKGILLILVVGASSLIFTELRLINIALGGEILVPILLSILIFILGFYGLRQTSIFLDNTFVINAVFEGQKPQVGHNPADKYYKTGLNLDDSKLRFEQLQTFIKDKKLYLDPELTLYKLATELGILPNQLSQVINQNAQQNFHAYINSHRVAEVITHLKDGKHQTQTLLSIAYEAGFNSKASFNRTFKKVTGLTPSAYLQQDEKN